MAYPLPPAWYINAGDGATTGYYAIPQFVVSKAYVVGERVRPGAAAGIALGNERAYVCILAGSVGSEPSWGFTKGSVTAALFMEATGEPGLNGDLVNCPQWTNSQAAPVGRVIYDPPSASIQICTVAGTSVSAKPTFSATAGVVTNDGASMRWMSLGLASNWGPFALPAARTLNMVATGFGVSGNDFYYADNSVEVSSGTIQLSTGSTTLPSRYISVDRNSITTLKPGASIKSANNVLTALGIGVNGSVSNYWYGVNFITSSNVNSAVMAFGANVANIHRFDNCQFTLDVGTVAGAYIAMGAISSGTTGIELVNCTFSFNLNSQFLAICGAVVTWRNTPDPILASGSAVPTTFFRPTSATENILLCEGVDFTALGTNILCANNNSGYNFTFKNCKLHTGPIVSGPTSSMPVINYDVINSDSGNTVYRNERYNLNGTLTTVTNVVRTGGATDGVTPVSHSILGSSFARTWKPFNAFPLVIWNDIVGVPRTVTLYGNVMNFLLVPYNDQFWFDVEYMGATGTPIASVVSTGLATQFSTRAQIAVADLVSAWDSAAPARQNSTAYSNGQTVKSASNPGRLFAANGAVNTGTSEPPLFATSGDGVLIPENVTGGSGAWVSNMRFSMSATFTPQQKGYLTIYPKLGTSPFPSFYLDPRPVLS